MAGGCRIKDYRDINGLLVQRSIYSVKSPSYSSFKNTSSSDSVRDAQAEARRRAFSLASLKLLCNPDLNCFITLTYDPKRNTNPDYLNDLKNLFRNTGTKYLATFERHKRQNPLLHIHIICTPTLNFYTNENGYLSVRRWHKGFSSVKLLSDFDNRFRASMYIFKYMNKSEKVKHKYVYSSRGLVTPPQISEISTFPHEAGVKLLMKDLQYHYGELNYKYKVIKGVRL